MKKLFGVILSLFVLVLSSSVFADAYSVFGGLKGEPTLKKGVYYYEEISFMSGKPVVLKGTVTVPTLPKTDSYKISVKYDLKNKEEDMALSRSVTYDVKKDKSNENRQIISNWTIPEGGLKETVKIKDKIYELSSFNFDNSRIIEEKPAIDFASSNIKFKKVFHTDGDLSDTGSQIIISGESETDLKYDNYWSNLESRIIRVIIEYNELPILEKKDNPGPEDKLPEKTESKSWSGTAVYKFSTKTQSSFENIVNDVRSISFKQGLLKNENSEDVLDYSYDMPVESETKNDQDTENKLIKKTVKRNKGNGKLATYVYKKSTRLPVPKYKDIGAHWAEEDIFKLASIEAFEMDDVFFPDVYITRAQFARAIVNSIGYIKPETDEEMQKELIKSKRKGAKPLPFEDVARNDRYFIFIDNVNTNKIMTGEGDGQFLPDRPLTRAEAVTVMMRSIGVDDISPILPFDSGFTDDKDIPKWAKPSMYMAREIGIIKGYEDGSAQPLKLMTRAEASAMLSGMIEHLRNDITLDYRERLLEGR